MNNVRKKIALFAMTATLTSILGVLIPNGIIANAQTRKDVRAKQLTQEEYLEMDVNYNGIIDQQDLDYVSKLYNTKVGDPDYDKRCDYTKDGIIDIYDIVCVSSSMDHSTYVSAPDVSVIRTIKEYKTREGYVWKFGQDLKSGNYPEAVKAYQTMLKDVMRRKEIIVDGDITNPNDDTDVYETVYRMIHNINKMAPNDRDWAFYYSLVTEYNNLRMNGMLK